MNRFTAVAAALALLVAGIAIGVLGTMLVLRRPGPPPPAHDPPPPERAIVELEHRLKLTDAQREQVRAILEQGRDESEAIRREIRPRLDAQIESVRERIDKLLTPEQHAAFEEMRRDARRRTERLLLDGGPPPGPGFDGPPRGPRHDGPPPFGGPPPR